MRRRSVGGSRSNARRVAGYAVFGAVPVLVLGLVLAGSYRTEARRRGIAEGRSEAQLVARAAIEPLLSGHPLSSRITEVESRGLARMTARAVAEGDVTTTGA
jgi:hypothetical protein